MRFHQQWYADRVNAEPDEPEVVPPARHRIGRHDRAHEDPGITPVVPPWGGEPGAHPEEDLLSGEHTGHPDHEVAQPFPGSGPARRDRGRLAAGLAPQ